MIWKRSFFLERKANTVRAWTKPEVDAWWVYKVAEILVLADISLLDIEPEDHVTIMVWRIWAREHQLTTL